MCALQILIYIIPITTLGGRYSGHIESMQKLCNFPSVMQVARSSWAQDRRASPAAPVLLTKNGPLVLIHSNAHVQLSNKGFLHI